LTITTADRQRTVIQRATISQLLTRGSSSCQTVSGIDSFAARAFCRHQASLEKATAIDYALSQLGVRVTEQYLPPSRILRLIGAIPAEV